MLRAYILAGFDPKHFWSLSPRLYLAQMTGARERLDAEQQSRAWLAWHIAGLQRQKTLPEAAKFIGGKSGQPERQSAEVLQAMGVALARAWRATSD